MRPRLLPLVVAAITLAPTALPQEAETVLLYDVPEHPTRLALTSDGVNAEGKQKTPGDALITRVRIEDRNGLGDVVALAFTYARDTSHGLVVVDAVDRASALAEDPLRTSLVVEDRYARSPLAAGDYVLNVTARDAAGASVSVTRTFKIAQAKPALLGLALDAPEVVPEGARLVRGTALVGDRNLAPGAAPGEVGALSLRVYRASSATAWNVTLSGPSDFAQATAEAAPYPYREVDGHGAFEIPFTIDVPPGAPAASYRVVVLHNGASLGNAPLAVRDLPRVETIRVVGRAEAGGNLTLEGNFTGALVRVRLIAAGAEALPPATLPAAGHARIAFPLPAALATGTYSVEVVALASEDGRAVAGAKGELLNGLRFPVKVVVAPRVRLRLPAEPAGFTESASGLVASLTVTNEGNVPLDHLIVRAGPTRAPLDLTNATATLLAGGAARGVARFDGAQAVLRGEALAAPGETVEVRLDLPAPPPARAGRYEIPVRVIAVLAEAPS